MKELNLAQRDAVALLRESRLNTDDGMPEELFLLVSALVPLPNVDLLIVNQQGELLLSRRNDGFFEKSWHIPGGCLRYGEDLLARAQKTAVREVGCSVRIDPTPIAVRNVIRGENPELPYPRERGHNVAILFRCNVPADFRIDNKALKENDNGYLKWFRQLPEDFMGIQHVYDDVLKPWIR